MSKEIHTGTPLPILANIKKHTAGIGGAAGCVSSGLRLGGLHSQRIYLLTRLYRNHLTEI